MFGPEEAKLLEPVDLTTIESIVAVAGTVVHNRSLLVVYWKKRRDQFSTVIIALSGSYHKA